MLLELLSEREGNMEKDEEDFPRRGIEKFTKKRKQEPDLFQVRWASEE